MRLSATSSNDAAIAAVQFGEIVSLQHHDGVSIGCAAPRSICDGTPTAAVTGHLAFLLGSGALAARRIGG